MTKLRVKKLNRDRRHKRTRAIINGTANRPRISVFKSNKYTYVQVIDDVAGKTLVGLSDIKVKTRGVKEKKAFTIGQLLSEELKKLGIASVVFDKSGFKYHGRVKQVAEGLRQGGIKV